ncbi:LysR family transcriptional regulator [Methylobacillus glycogenes]|uniref:LysR family transcriptional regulator n=1 Tax=Methylobacillus glycogenes TaxID=406 RepID=UPI00047047F1|nr:LysR family transcriptional regulator [Methylobacillus glycogenes]
MDKLKAMQLFVAAVDTGSFAAAGESLGLSPPRVTAQIQELEESLGTTLIVRTTRQRRLTDAGKRYYDSCKSILEDISVAELEAQELGAQPKGRLRISAAVAFGDVLAGLVSKYLAENPDITVELILNDRFVDIIEEGYDIAIRIGKLEDSTLIARQLGDYRLTICASPEYLAANGTPEKPQDLASHKCLGFTLWRNQSGWRAFLSQLSSSPMTRLESNNVAALHIAAKNGIGLLLIPRNLVEEDIKAKKLIEILPSYLPDSMPINAVYPKSRQTSPKLKSFVNFLQAHYQ